LKEETVMMYNTAGTAAARAAIANAIKASGAIVRAENKGFLTVVQKTEKPLVVMTCKSFWSPNYKYITGYRGLVFFTKSKEMLNLPGDAEFISCREINIPS
jgi:hypothetical protein